MTTADFRCYTCAQAGQSGRSCPACQNDELPLRLNASYIGIAISALAGVAIAGIVVVVLYAFTR